jgi:hypothetical protein
MPVDPRITPFLLVNFDYLRREFAFSRLPEGRVRVSLKYACEGRKCSSCMVLTVQGQSGPHANLLFRSCVLLCLWGFPICNVAQRRESNTTQNSDMTVIAQMDSTGSSAIEAVTPVEPKNGGSEDAAPLPESSETNNAGVPGLVESSPTSKDTGATDSELEIESTRIETEDATTTNGTDETETSDSVEPTPPPATSTTTASSAALYHYDSLPHPDSLRILKLLPGKANSPLIAELLQVRHSDTPSTPYEALSYRWGADKLPQIITDNTSKKLLRITQNLFDALQALRLEDGDRNLWIDAVCIDQKNDAEKSQQVKQMGEIYKSATKVIVWLGRDAPGASAKGKEKESKNRNDKAGNAIKSLDVLGGKFEEFGWKSVFPVPTKVVNKDALGGYEKEMKEFQAGELRDLFRREWFERVWVLQEFILAKDLGIRCGAEEVSYEHFSKALCALNLVYTRPELTDLVVKENGELYEVLTSDAALQAWALVQRRERFWAASTGKAVKFGEPAVEKTDDKTKVEKDKPKAEGLLVKKPEEDEAEPATVTVRVKKASLIEQCVSTRKLKCADDRDRVYGVLGLSNNDIGIEPDYSRKAETLWPDLALKSLVAGDLTILHYAGKRSDNEKLPSYAVDFGSPNWDGIRLGGYTNPRFHAGTTVIKPRITAVPNLKPSEDQPSAYPQVSGVVADKIIAHAYLQRSREDSSAARLDQEEIRALWGLCKDWVGMTSRTVHPNDLLKAFSRIVVLDNAHPVTHSAFYSEERNDPQMLIYLLLAMFSEFKQDGKLLVADQAIAGLIGPFTMNLSLFPDEPQVNYQFPSKTLKPVAYWPAPDSTGVPKSTKRGLGRRKGSKQEDKVRLVHLEGPIVGRLVEYMTKVSVVMAGRALFTTSRGYIGLGPRNIKKDDVVYIPFGAETPFVVEDVTTADGASSTGAWYEPGKETEDQRGRERIRMGRLVGECYLQGWMDGELLELKRRASMENLVLV